MISLAPQHISNITISNVVSSKIERAGERAYKDAVAAGLTGEALNDVVTAAARKAFTRFTGYTYCGNGMVKVAG